VRTALHVYPDAFCGFTSLAADAQQATDDPVEALRRAL